MTRPAWGRALATRFLFDQPLKILSTAVGLTIFFTAYFWVMDHPAPGASLRVVPLLAPDHWVAIQEWALVPYASLWLYVCLAPALAADRPEFLRYVRGCLILCAVGFSIFWLLPTTVPEFDVDWSAYPSLQFLKSQDGGANALPSLHVAFATFAGAVLNDQLRTCAAPRMLRAVNFVWALLIVYSALATRQHVLLDAVAGMLLGVVAFVAVRGGRSRRPHPAGAAAAPVAIREDPLGP